MCAKIGWGISIKPRYTVYYPIFERSDIINNTPKSNKRVNDISTKSKRRILSYCDWLISTSINKKVICTNTNRSFTFKLAFITLTLPALQIHPDEVIRQKCLEPLLRRLRNKHGMKSYIWKAETQLNGNIHFHITTNVFIHYKQLRRYWNNRLLKLGYLLRCKYDNPPTTEIKCVKSMRDISIYLAKYIAKTENDRTKPLCKLWDCSNNLKQIKFSYNNCQEDYDTARKVYAHINLSDNYKDLDYATIYYYNRRVEDRYDPISCNISEQLYDIIKDTQPTKVYHTKLWKITASSSVEPV